jgi:hypothetical protein
LFSAISRKCSTIFMPLLPLPALCNIHARRAAGNPISS